MGTVIVFGGVALLALILGLTIGATLGGLTERRRIVAFLNAARRMRTEIRPGDGELWSISDEAAFDWGVNNARRVTADAIASGHAASKSVAEWDMEKRR